MSNPLWTGSYVGIASTVQYTEESIGSYNKKCNFVITGSGCLAFEDGTYNKGASRIRKNSFYLLGHTIYNAS